MTRARSRWTRHGGAGEDGDSDMLGMCHVDKYLEVQVVLLLSLCLFERARGLVGVLHVLL